MSLPPLAPVPPASIRLSIAPSEWQACLDAWLGLTNLYLRLPSGKFDQGLAHDAPLISYLKTYYHELASSPLGDDSLRGSHAAQALLRTAFRLVHRICAESKHNSALIDWALLADVCLVHARSTALAQVLQRWAQVQRDAVEKLLQRRKEILITSLESSTSNYLDLGLRQLPAVMHACPDFGIYFMTGSDFLDALASAHGKPTITIEQRRFLVSTAYLGLSSVLKTEPPNFSLLTDHLYSLKSSADRTSGAASFLADVVTNTPLILALRRGLNDHTPARLIKLLDIADAFQQPSLRLPRKQHGQARTHRSKGKEPQPNGELHVHQLSLVTQVQDLFPDLGSGFVLKLLEEYHDDVEQVTARLLDDSLPPHLRSLDRTEQASVFDRSEQNAVQNLVPRSTPPPVETFIPERHNVFDEDELDQLDIDAGRLHLGKREDRMSQLQPNKAAILSALAAFDSDDDERDDTYDVDDVGGTVDAAHPEGEPGAVLKPAPQENHDTALFATYKSHPELFGRTFDVRRSQPRQELKRETGLTDEAIEGWAIMLQRDPRRLKRLEAQLGAFDGRQAALSSTAYRESPNATETEDDSDAPGGATGRGSFRGRGGRGRGGRARGRGGSVSGPSNEASTAAAQRNKEANKGRRANHNRRDQRAKKMARGGFPG